jgi:hypothetical protein
MLLPLQGILYMWVCVCVCVNMYCTLCKGDSIVLNVFSKEQQLMRGFSRKKAINGVLLKGRALQSLKT